MPQDEVKSLVNSVNMVKNMVESIVTAVQDRFKDYDNIIVTLKERIDKLENQPATKEQVSSTDSSTLTAKIQQLEKRLDSLNERILLIEATKSVTEKPKTEVTDAQTIKDLAEKEAKPAIATEPAPTPVSTIDLKPETEPTVEVEPTIPSEPLAKEAPSIPVPTPPEPIKKPTTEMPTKPKVETPKAPTPTEMPTKPKVETPKAPTPTEMPKPQPATKVTETAVERDVSPISKTVSGTIPSPPSQVEKSVPQTTPEVQPQITKTEDSTAPEEGKSAELFSEAVSGDKAELLKALKKLEDL